MYLTYSFRLSRTPLTNTTVVARTPALVAPGGPPYLCLDGTLLLTLMQLPVQSRTVQMHLMSCRSEGNESLFVF
jgi:hypothetical protein